MTKAGERLIAAAKEAREMVAGLTWHRIDDPMNPPPKDGTEILACYCVRWDWQDKPTVYGPWTVAFRGNAWMASWEDAPVIESESWAGTEYKNAPVDPTHWMPRPLPPPPVTP